MADMLDNHTIPHNSPTGERLTAKAKELYAMCLELAKTTTADTEAAHAEAIQALSYAVVASCNAADIDEEATACGLAMGVGCALAQTSDPAMVATIFANQLSTSFNESLDRERMRPAGSA